MKILFLGTPLFARIVLKHLVGSKHKVVGVITQPDRPAGRGHKLVASEVKKYALANDIPVYTFEKVNKSIDEIKKIDYDYALTASFGQILSEEFLSYKPCLNVHPSILPKYRGSTPIQSALYNGDSVTGVTIMKMVKEVDAGDILLQSEYKIEDTDNTDSLMVSLGEVGGQMAVEAFDLIESGKVKFVPQDGSKATFVKLLGKEDGRLDFNRPAKDLVNQFRAYGTRPGCYMVLGDDIIKVGGLRDASSEFNGKNGQVLLAKKRFIIGCQNGAVEVLYAQAPSGKMLKAQDFLNGYRFKEGVNA